MALWVSHEDKTEQVSIHGITLSNSDFSGDLNHQGHHPICGQGGGQQQHYIEATEGQQWKTLLIPDSYPRGQGDTGGAT